jgi:hypothetical protein
MGQNRVGETQGNKSFAHPNFISKDLDLEAPSRSWVKEAIKQDVHSGLLAGGVFGVLDARAISS